MDLVIATALLSLVDEAGDAFLQAHEQLEDDERRFLQASSAS
jgi:hypothetical protein